MKFEKANCPICESKNFKLISRKGHFRIPIFVSVCKKCGLVMLNPRWDEKSYSNFYEKEYDLEILPQEHPIKKIVGIFMGKKRKTPFL